MPKIIADFIYNYRFLISYFLLISAISMIFTIADKISAIKAKRRVSEATLFILAIIGGALAMFLTMIFIRHKTKHLRFMIGLPLILIVEILLVYFVIKYGIPNF